MKKLFMIISFFWPCFSFAAENANLTSGTCGDHCSWSMENGTLKLSGYGDISRYGLYSAPWFWDASHITKIVIENSSDTQTFKSIGEGTFCALTAVKEVILPEGLEKIGPAAFHYNLSLEKVNFPDSLKHISWGAFNQTKIKDFILPENVTIETNASLGSVNTESIVIPPDVFVTKDMLLHTVKGDWNNYELSLNLKTIYCDIASESCQTLLSDDDLASKITTYRKEGNMYVIGEKKYKSLNNMKQGLSVKRIYTLEEAIEASGKRNSVFIRYK